MVQRRAISQVGQCGNDKPVWRDSVSDSHNSDVYLWGKETVETNTAKVQRASSPRKFSSQDSKPAK